MEQLGNHRNFFPHKDIHKNTWKSPDGKTHSQIDQILVNPQFRRSILDTIVRRGAEVASDHGSSPPTTQAEKDHKTNRLTH